MARTLKETTDLAREKVRVAADRAAQKTAGVREAASEKASAIYARSRTTGENLGTRLVTGIKEKPVTAMVGGIALGVLIGALLPRLRTESAGESNTLDNYRAKATDTFKAISDRLDSFGVDKDLARETIAKAREVARDATTIAANVARDALQRAKPGI